MNKEKELQYRKAKQINTITCFEHETAAIPLCPTCNGPIFVEYTNYCSICGQKLSWKGYRKIKITFI